jgi:hypothetical protein
MKLTIDNLQGSGPQDYTAALDSSVSPKIERKLNKPAQLRLSLVASSPAFVVPLAGARITLGKTSGNAVFTGYLTQSPHYEYLGWGALGPIYRYNLVAESDEVLLDRKTLPNRSPFVARSAGEALRQLAQDLLPGGFDTSAVQDVDILAWYEANPQKKFSEHAAEIALAARGSYRAMNGALVLAPVGATTCRLHETDESFSAEGLTLASPNLLVNDATVIGPAGPKAYARDYFVGDGLSRKFYMAQKPFTQSTQVLIDEQYAGAMLDPTIWVVSDPSSAVSVMSQTLQVAGGNGADGQTAVAFSERVELGGALQLQHGDVVFSGASQGLLGGLYAGAISVAGCLAGFQIMPSGGDASIQALINGSAAGPVLVTTLGHHYVLTTYIYSAEVYRSEEIYHSSSHPAGQGWGGETVTADVRFVLEVHDVDPANPATMVAPASVLYDGVIAGAADFCTYALINAMNMHCSIAYTHATHISLAEVRTALPGSGYVTQLVGSLSDGAQCVITGDPALDFYPQYVPALNELIVISYRGSGRTIAEVTNEASITRLQNGLDNGIRGAVRHMKAPSPRTGADCENAAQAILDDGAGAAWTGTYQTWSDFLPSGAADIFPGDTIQVNVPSRSASFDAIVRQVTIDVVDPTNDRGRYAIEFANDLATPLALQYESAAATIPLQDVPPRLTTSQVGTYYLADLKEAQITQVASTTVQVDAGLAPATGGGIEVRAHDYGWGQANDRNLLGRFSTQTFSLPRLARTQNYFLRLYDNSSPARYSRYSAALHLDYPL